MYTLEVLNWHQLGHKTIITHRQLKTAWSDIKPCLFYIWDTRDPQQRPWTAAELCQISGCYRRSPRWVCEWHCMWRPVQSNPPDQWAAAVVPREAHSPMTWWIGLWITIPSKKDAEALKFNCYSSYHSKRINSVIDREQYAWNLEKKYLIFEIENVKYIMNALCSDIF